MFTERRAWTWIDWAIFGIFTSWLAMGLLVLGTNPKFVEGSDRYVVLAGILISYFAPLLAWRPGYTNKLLLPLLILFSGGATEIYIAITSLRLNSSIIVFPMLIVGFVCNGKKLLSFVITVFVFALPVTTYVVSHNEIKVFSTLLDFMLSNALMLAIGFGIQRVYRSNQRTKKLYEENLRQYQLIQEQNKALEQYAEQVEKLTLLEERNRLARELHDTVGHTFTSVIMGMDAVSYLIEMAPEKAKEKLDVLRNVTRNGLEEVRRSIHQIAPKSDDSTLTQQLARLANEFAVHTGTVVQFTNTGLEPEMAKQTQLTLIRCLQESLTNAKRHGNAANVEIGLEFHDSQVLLRVEDDGLGTENLEAGFGLKAMRERLAALQGTLHVVSSPGAGTVVTCIVPLRR